MLCFLTLWCSFSTLLKADVWFDSYCNICGRLCPLPGFHFVETAREGSTTAKQGVANRRHAIFLTEVGLEVYKSILLTLFRYWRSITTRKDLKLLRVSSFAPEIRNLKSQVVITCWPWRDWQFAIIMVNTWIRHYGNDLYVDQTIWRYRTNYWTRETLCSKRHAALLRPWRGKTGIARNFTIWAVKPFK